MEVILNTLVPLAGSCGLISDEGHNRLPTYPVVTKAIFNAFFGQDALQKIYY